MQIENILIGPVVTEKTSTAQGKGKYSFFVHSKANKIEVTQAVEKNYGVKVESVNIIPVRKKVRMAGRKVITKRSAAKKAIVTLEPKQTLDFNKLKASK